MFRDEVAEHYRNKGYKLHPNVKVRGGSGAVHACDLVAQGPLGNLVISFGDDSDFEGPEMGAVRRAARDIGATPVVAAENMPEGIRQLAARAGVVLLDRRALDSTPAPVRQFIAAEPEEVEPVPWPSAEPRVKAAKPEPVLRNDVAAKPAKVEPFSWLPKKAAPVEEKSTRPAGVVEVHVPVRRQDPIIPLRYVILAVLAGGTAGLVYFGLNAFL